MRNRSDARRGPGREKGGKLKKLATAAVATAMLVTPPVASAKTIRHDGQIVGDNATRIKLKVETNGNNPKQIDDFRAKNIFTRCKGQASRIDFKVLDAVEVKENNGFKVRLTDGEDGILRISGKVKNNGNRVVGNMKTNDFESANGQTCKMPKQRFKTSKR